mmetsp:Transcript_46899/g.54348  ORF Transcript_46899/g.54348 Transcript_46899/m.54348 type:complete len:292 (+) Transcript_46899:21-896(+)
MLSEALNHYLQAISELIRHPIRTLKLAFWSRISGPISVLKNLVIFLFVCMLCYTVAAGLYAFIYNSLIPSAMQSEALIFTQTANGSEVRIFDSRANFPQCLAYDPSNGLSKGGKDSLCINKNSTRFAFSPETYNVNLKLVLGQINKTLTGKNFAVQTELISSNKFMTYVHETNGTYVDPVSRMFLPLRLLYKLGREVLPWRSGIQLELQLMENFENARFDVQVLTIRTQERIPELREAYLTLEPQLHGLRYLMVNWFWTCSLIFIVHTATSFITLYTGYRLMKLRQKTKKN